MTKDTAPASQGHFDPANFVSLFLLLWLLWLAFTTSFDPQEVVVGGVVAAIVSLLSIRLLPLGTSLLASPRRTVAFLLYVPLLLWWILLANIDVAKRVLQPKLNINPGIVRVRTKLRSATGRLLLANSITLTPGTLSVDIQGDDLFIHWIDVQAEDIDVATQKIVSGFEKYLEVIFG